MGSNKKYKVIDCPELKSKKIVCLTLDVEQDYGDLLEEPCYEGLEYIPEVVKSFKNRRIPLTCFVQGSLFETHPSKIQELTEINVEFELHSYSHPKPGEGDTRVEIEKSIEAYNKFFGREPIGYRFPLGVFTEEDYKLLAVNNFKFDSSIFPSVRLGAFNNLGKPTRPFRLDNLEIVEFPFTVISDFIRIPIALSYIKLLGSPYFYFLKTFDLPNLIIFDFHIHDLVRLNSSGKIPINKNSFIYQLIFRRIYQNSQDGFAILDRLISILKNKGYSFHKLRDIYEVISK